ncbi:MAG TPA: phosphate/phosphite/phosphonate ABC transporter substrate-binding protein [Planctomycetota bacterium]|jgi:ABC-type phosphate/phosphonate transport system substrate-binding protein|nr:phosphate/phosphite/phosphonate ABC transporter substrate-binding protein [Planctomycetota bacterium]
MSADPILVGAVAYDPKAVTIWEGLREHFRDRGVPMDFVLFSNYERQVEELLAGHVDIAWNTPLAHVRVRRRTGGRSISLGMRDTDRDFRSKILVRRNAGIRTLSDLRGKILAVGSRDSTQARILPLHFLSREGLDLSAVRLLPFDTDVGKHGDTGTSELEVLRALHEGRADAGAVGDLVWVAEQAAGHVDPSRVEVLWTTPPFDHCMFDALPSAAPAKLEAFREALFAMRWEDPRHRRIMELEGLKAWVPPREEGYRSLHEALEAQERG